MLTGNIILLVILIVLILATLVFFLSKSYCENTKLGLKASSKVESQIEDLFSSQGGQVKCIGSGTEPVELISGKTNYIWCGFRPVTGGQYRIVKKTATTNNASLDANSWFFGSNEWLGTASLSDTDPKKIFTLNIPGNLTNVTMRVELEVYYPGSNQAGIEILDFKINKINWFKNLIC